MVANRVNGKKGGLVTAARHGEAFCVARGIKGGTAVRDRYGSDFYSFLNKKRKHHKGWPKGRPRKQLEVQVAGA